MLATTDSHVKATGQVDGLVEKVVLRLSRYRYRESLVLHPDLQGLEHRVVHNIEL